MGAAAIGHDWEWIETTAPTYTTEGVETKTCKHDLSHTDGTRIIYKPFTSDFAAWLAAQPKNSPSTAYDVKLNVSDLGGDFSTSGSIGNALYTNDTKYVNLDLSRSNITRIGSSAFEYCTSLISVTFETGSNINITSFSNTSFPERNTGDGAYIKSSNIRGYSSCKTAYYSNC